MADPAHRERRESGMDVNRVDAVARGLGNGASRRGALALLAGAAGLGVREVTAKRHRRNGTWRRTAKGAGPVQTASVDKFDVEEVDEDFVDEFLTEACG